MVLSLEGKESSLPVLRVFTVLLFNKCKGFPALVVGTITSSGAQLRIASEPPDGVCWCQELAFPAAMELLWHLSLCPCRGCPARAGSAFSALLAAHLHAGGLRCRAAVP